MEREKGVTTAPCFRCGEQLPTVVRADGACAAALCSCPTETIEVASTGQVEIRELGVVDLDDVIEELDIDEEEEA